MSIRSISIKRLQTGISSSSDVRLNFDEKPEDDQAYSLSEIESSEYYDSEEQDEGTSQMGSESSEFLELLQGQNGPQMKMRNPNGSKRKKARKVIEPEPVDMEQQPFSFWFVVAKLVVDIFLLSFYGILVQVEPQLCESMQDDQEALTLEQTLSTMIGVLIADVMISVVLSPYVRIFNLRDGSVCGLVAHYALNALDVTVSLALIIVTGLEYKFMRQQHVQECANQSKDLAMVVSWLRTLIIIQICSFTGFSIWSLELACRGASVSRGQETEEISQGLNFKKSMTLSQFNSSMTITIGNEQHSVRHQIKKESNLQKMSLETFNQQRQDQMDLQNGGVFKPSINVSKTLGRNTEEGISRARMDPIKSETNLSSIYKTIH